MSLLLAGLGALGSLAGKAFGSASAANQQRQMQEYQRDQEIANQKEQQRRASAASRMSSLPEDATYASIYANGGYLSSIPMISQLMAYANGGVINPNPGFGVCPYGRAPGTERAARQPAGRRPARRAANRPARVAVRGAGGKGVAMRRNADGPDGQAVQDTAIVYNSEGLPMAIGGQIPMMGMQGVPIDQYETGGTHEQNPYGGVPLNNGNSVEEGEVRFGNYVFSNRF